MRIADLRYILPDGTYTIAASSNHKDCFDALSIFDSDGKEVYCTWHRDPLGGNEEVYHSLNGDIFIPVARLPIMVNDWLHNGSHTMYLNGGSCIIDDMLSRRVFSLRPDGFYYKFKYKGTISTGKPSDFPYEEYNSDGVNREYREHDGVNREYREHDGEYACTAYKYYTCTEYNNYTCTESNKYDTAPLIRTMPYRTGD